MSVDLRAIREAAEKARAEDNSAMDGRKPTITAKCVLDPHTVLYMIEL